MRSLSSAQRAAPIFGVLYLATFAFSITGVLLYNPADRHLFVQGHLPDQRPRPRRFT
jgi:hypothetical protein